MEYLVLIIMVIIAVGYIFKSSLSETDASKKANEAINKHNEERKRLWHTWMCWKNGLSTANMTENKKWKDSGIIGRYVIAVNILKIIKI